LSAEGLYGARYQSAAASLLVVRGSGTARHRLGEVRTEAAQPAEFSIALRPGDYRLRLEGVATRADGAAQPFVYESGLLHLVPPDHAAQLLAQALSRHGAVLSELAHPPEEGRVLATISPGDFAAHGFATANKAWLTGLYPRPRPAAMGMVFPGGTGSRAGDYCAVHARVRLPATGRPIRAQVFRADGYGNPDWPGYRCYQLLVNGQVVWEEDITRDEGQSRWASVDVTAAVAGKREVEVTLRILDRRGVGNYGTASLLGPVRFVAGSRPPGR
jgi:hypothetical protein